MAQKVQLAIQGGGAKLVALLAASQAIHDLRQAGVLEITRIAGTSAGAITGALLAWGIEPNSVRTELAGQTGRELAKALSLPNALQFFFQSLAKNQAIWNLKPIRELLTKFIPMGLTFEALEKKTGVRLSTISATLDAGQVRIHSGTELVVESVLHSGALPFLFRVWDPAGGETIVDGGICENLPVDVLLEDEDTFGPVVALTFNNSTSGWQTKNAATLALALLDTAINNSVSRARSRLQTNSVLEINTHLTTFDFDQAFSTDDKGGLGKHYIEIRDQSRRFFEEFIRRKVRPISGLEDDPWASTNKSTQKVMEAVYRAYEAGEGKIPFKRPAAVFAVVAKSLVPSGEFDHGPDQALSWSIIEPEAKPVTCLLVGTTGASHVPRQDYLGRTDWEVTDRNDPSAVFQILPVAARNPDKPRSRFIVLHFFPPLSVGEQYELLVRDEGHGYLGGLANPGGKDTIALTIHRASSPVPQIDLVACLPPQFQTARFQYDAQNSFSNGQPIPGLGGFSGYNRPFGFRTMVWRGRNIPSEKKFGVEIIR